MKEKVKHHATNKPHPTKSPLEKGTTQRVRDFVQQHHYIQYTLKLNNPLSVSPLKKGEVDSN